MKVFAGSYTQHVIADLKGDGDGLYLFEFDKKNGQLTLEQKIKTTNPGYLQYFRQEQVIYTFQELSTDKSPKLRVYGYSQEKISLKEEVEINGGLPCHLLHIVAHKLLVVSCYQTGNIHIYEHENGGLNLRPFQSIQHSGQSINAERQEGPHAHMAYFDVKRQQLIVADLGIDKLMVYHLEDRKFNLIQDIVIPAGGGPRHFGMHPKGQTLFAINEMTAEVSFIVRNNGKWRWHSNVKASHAEHNNHASASAIKISPCGQFIYCGVRSSNTISILKYDEANQSLSLIDEHGTMGITPRDFELSPDGRWLIVANQDSESIVIFKRNKESGLLSFQSENKETRSVCCIKFE